jgi:primosomal protein N'
VKSKYKPGEKVRFEFKDNATRVGFVKKIKKGLLNNKYLITVEYPSSFLNQSVSTYFYWIEESKIIEKLVPGYKGYC